MIDFDCRLRKNIVSLLLSLIFVLAFCGEVFALEAVLKKIIVYHDPCSIKLVLSKKIPFKVIKIDKKEILIALKNVRTGSTSGIKGEKGTPIKDISIEHLSGRVLALIVTGFKEFIHLDSSWKPSDSALWVSLEKKKILQKKTLSPVNKGKRHNTENRKTKKLNTIKKAGSLEKASPPLKTLLISQDDKIDISPERKKSIFAGDVSDLIIKAEVSGCASETLLKAVNFLKTGLWHKGFNLLNNYIEKNGKNCLEQAYFLRAFAAMKYAGSDDTDKLIRAAGFFQNALVTYPGSRLAPFAFASLGIIHSFLENPAVAEGFFNLVADDYENYPGLPEVLYHLAEIYEGHGYHEKALKYYKRVFEDFPVNTHTVDAGIGIGKELFQEKYYIDSLKILSYLVKTNPAKLYKSPELLLVIGNANLELSRSGPARKNLLKVLNFFPDIKSKDMILTHIGDTYAMEKNFVRAEDIYRLVMKKFPGGEGYVTSAMNLAGCLKDRSEKEKIYAMIKKDFSDNEMAGVAMLRLAELYNKYKEYAKCIKEIEDLLATHPRGLRYEAVKLMQKAYESLFDKQLKSDQYPEILKRYEKKHALLDRLDSRKIFLSVGLAYGRAHLNNQAFHQLIKAYKLYKISSRPPELLFELGAVMDDSGRKDDALKILNAFVIRFRGNSNVVEAYRRIGNIFLEKNKPVRAVDNFSMAYNACQDNLIKGEILKEEAQAYKLKKNWKKVSNLLVKALDSFALAKGTHYLIISSAYRDLGVTYMNQKLYVKAGDAFSMAVKFSGENHDAADLGFMMGDAYEKANIIKKAKQAFEKVAAGDDSIWSRLAKERLLTLKLANEVKNS